MEIEPFAIHDYIYNQEHVIWFFCTSSSSNQEQLLWEYCMQLSWTNKNEIRFLYQGIYLQ